MSNFKSDDLISRLRENKKVRVLFVCLGNICRSPAAEEIMRAICRERGLSDRFEIDSAGTYSGHAGQLPDQRMRVHAVRRGYNLTHRARPVCQSDFEDFDIIVGMDDNNLRDLRRLSPSCEDDEKIVRMVDFCRMHPYYYAVPDPYYEGASGFELVLDLLEDACSGMIDSLTPQD